MPKKAMTIEDLAHLINGNTEAIRSSAKAIDELARMTKDSFDGVEKHLNEHDKKLDKIEDRVQRIELVLITDHKRRIERLEDEVMKLKSHAR